MLPLIIGRRRYRRMIAQLARRGEGRRESGAFLLGRADSRRITAVAFYDDLDATSLTGSIQFHASGYTRLNEICRSQSLHVLADIHTHPGEHARQSGIDSNNPMVALAGHVALIAPDYACGRQGLGRLGAHVYLGNGQWSDHPNPLDVLRHPNFVDCLWPWNPRRS